MRVIGLTLLDPWITPQLKAIWNDQGLVIFPASTQHREAGVDRIRYDDDGRGNALAVMLTPERFEVRGHPHFTPERVKNMWWKLRDLPEAAQLRNCQLIYQGIPLFSK